MREIKKKLLGRWIRLRELINLLVSNEVYLIYQMGKVGSTSVYESLLEKSSVPVFQLHRFRLVPGTFVSRGAWKTFQRKLWARTLYFLVKNKNIKILSLTRKPVARNVSDYFQTLDHYLEVNNLKASSVTLDELKMIFYGQYPHFSSVYWFDEQVKKVFGIDVYSGEGFRFSRDNVQMLVVRMEDLEEKQKEISDFFSVPGLAVRGSNTAEKKWYAQLYLDFKKEGLSKEYYDLMNSSRYYKKFYKGDF